MKNTLSSPVVVISLFFVTISLVVAVRVVYRTDSTANQQAGPNPIGIFTILQVHSGHMHQEWLRFTQQGTLMYSTNFSAGSQQVLKSRLRLSTDHTFVRYEKVTLNRHQSFLFDGNTVVRTTFEAETQVDVRALDGIEAESIKFQMATFGLLPILKRLSDPSTQVVYVGAASKGNRFQVKTAGGSWYFYTNSNHLINRLEVGDIEITYEDYRTVDGLNLPFSQRVKKGDRLLYEIRFDTFDPNPVFAAGFFKSTLL